MYAQFLKQPRIATAILYYLVTKIQSELISKLLFK